MRAHIVAIALLAGCGAERGDVEDAKLGPVAFEVPVDWQRTNLEPSGAKSADWKPASNARRESLVVVRSALLDPRALKSSERLAELLAGAQGTLRNAKVSTATPLATRRGLYGARIDVSFQPGDGVERYRRVHAVLVDAETSELVHVLYTAAQPDDNLTAFYTVLESLHREEG